MIQSLQRIDFLYGGRAIRLLDFGQFIAAEIPLPISIKGTDYNATGDAWGDGITEGSAKRSLAWQVRRDHDNHKQVRSFCISHGELVPKQARGVLRLSIIDADRITTDPEIWELSRARILAAEPAPLEQTGYFRTVTSYRVETGSARPISIITPFPGMPITWYNQPLTSLTQPITSY